MARFERKIPEGDSIEREVCLDCGHIAYQNPKIVVGSVVVHEGRVLLCRRAIEPRLGFWTLPAGFMELHETPEEGARREALEEAEARIKIEALLGVYTVKHLSQVQILFRASFEGAPQFSAGVETQELGLFAWDDIPWADIAFPSVKWVLDLWHAGLGVPVGETARGSG